MGQGDRPHDPHQELFGEDGVLEKLPMNDTENFPNTIDEGQETI